MLLETKRITMNVELKENELLAYNALINSLKTNNVTETLYVVFLG